MPFTLMPQKSVKIDYSKVDSDDLLRLTFNGNNDLRIFLEAIPRNKIFQELGPKLVVPRRFWPHEITHERLWQGSHHYVDLHDRLEKWHEHTTVQLSTPYASNLNYGERVEFLLVCDFRDGYGSFSGSWTPWWNKITDIASVTRAQAESWRRHNTTRFVPLR